MPFNSPTKPDRIEDIIAYHDRTKHHPDQYARGPGFLDWRNQPNPFRRFSGSPVFPLPLASHDETPPAAILFRERNVPPLTMSREALGLFFELSLGLSARKETAGTSWYLRMNPSSGNLHPTEAYAILPSLGGLLGGAGVYHYAPLDHALEQRARYPQESPPDPSVFWVGITSIVWREAWKYGERAFRYCQHDTGHAVACLRFAAAVLGWQLKLLPQWSELQIARLLGLDRKEDFSDAEEETPELLVEVTVRVISTSAPVKADVNSISDRPSTLPAKEGENLSVVSGPRSGLVQPEQLLLVSNQSQWFGRANRLSLSHMAWPVINKAIACSERCLASNKPVVSDSFWNQSPPGPPVCNLSAGQLIRRRRSAVDFDGATGISRNQFLAMLDTTLPRDSVPPFDAWPYPPRIHLVLFVHRVEGLEAGLYLWLRSPSHRELLQRALHHGFEWKSLPEVPLFCLRPGDLREFARAVSCEQDIAADSAFSLGMLARFKTVLQESGPKAYRELFWEAGLIGQTLYMAAEATGMRGTGMGCYLDDVMHHALGLKNHDWQSLYHFTIGSPVEDPRLRSQDPYRHLHHRRKSPAGSSGGDSK